MYIASMFFMEFILNKLRNILVTFFRYLMIIWLLEQNDVQGD